MQFFNSSQNKGILYPRSEGWRRDQCSTCVRDNCNNGTDCYFGFGGPNQGGFGRYGMYGGYRSFYNYMLTSNKKECNKIYENETVNFVSVPNSYCNNEIVFVTFLLIILTFYIFIQRD